MITAGAGIARASIADGLDRCLTRFVEALACVALVTEIVILFTGIVARTVFNQPIIWSDELASILFLWLAMLGSVLAVQHGTNMRLTFFVTHVSPRGREWLETLATGMVCLFFALLVSPCFDYLDDQSYAITPALGWSGVVRGLAMPVGMTLALAAGLLRLRHATWSDLLSVALLLAVAAAAMYVLAPWFIGIGNWSLVVFFVVLLGAAVGAGVPIAFCFGLATTVFLLTTTTTPLAVVIGRMDEGMSALVLLAVPLFVFLGQLVEITGMAAVMVNFLAALIGHVRAGMSYVLIGAILLVSGISGSKTADMAAVAPVLFPEMRKRGMVDGELISLLAAAGAMSETIPPSIVLIAIASVTGVSIAALFTAGILPGVVLAIVIALVARWRAGHEPGAEPQQRAPFDVVRRTFLRAAPAIVLPFLIRTAVVRGIATATEVSTIGIGYALVAGLTFYRGGLNWRRMAPLLIRTASLSGAILFIVGSASAMAWALTQSGFSQNLAEVMRAVPGGGNGFLLISILAFIVLGSVLEGIPAIVLFGPLLFPIARTLGINEVHYAIVVILAMGLGIFAPPFGLCYYAGCIIGQVSPEAAMRRIWIYLGALLLGLMVIAFVPWISTGFLD